MRLFFTADEHYGHQNILKYCERPFKTIEEMDRTLWTNYIKLVNPGDCCIHVGDMSFNSKPVREGMTFRCNDIFLRGSHDNPSRYKITSLMLRYAGLDIQVVHDLAEASVIGQDLVFCGHVHDNWKWKFLPSGSLAINVGVDVWCFSPVEMKDLMGLVKTAHKLMRSKQQIEG